MKNHPNTNEPWWRPLTLAVLDPQSGLYGAEYLCERLSAELSQADGDGSPFCLLVLDWIGDHGRRPTSDRVQAVAHALFSTARPVDVPARLGHRRFALLLPSVSADVAQRIGASIRLDLMLEGDGREDGWRLSCLEYPGQRSLLEELLRNGGARRRDRAA